MLIGSRNDHDRNGTGSEDERNVERGTFLYRAEKEMQRIDGRV